MPFPFDVVDVTLLPEVDLAALDVVGFAVPTDFWGISQRVSGFIAELPLQHGKPAFVINTFGGASGKALVRLWEAVSSRGFRVAAGYSAHMPDSYPPLIARGFASAGAPSTSELAKLDSFIAKLAATLSAIDDGHEAPSGRLSLGLMDRLLPERDRSTGLHAMGERSVDGQACTRCGTCVKGCLTGAIRLDPLPVPRCAVDAGDATTAVPRGPYTPRSVRVLHSTRVPPTRSGNACLALPKAYRRHRMPSTGWMNRGSSI
jgi:ferredoxin